MIMDSARPLLVFPHPEVVETLKRSGGGSRPPLPRQSPSRHERIRGRFMQAINFIQNTPGDMNHVLVIETVGTLRNFHDAVGTIPGFEWIAEFDDFDIDEATLDEMYDPGDIGYEEAKKAGRRFYLTSSNQSALKDLLSKYKTWEDTNQIAHGFRIWKDFFTYITDIRLWNEKDRLESTGILEKWRKEWVANRGTASPCHFEILLQYEGDKGKADSARNSLISDIKKLGGKITKTYCNPNIAFDALKVELLIMRIGHLLDAYDANSGYPQWIQNSAVKYCRPISQQLTDSTPGEESDDFTVGMPNDNPPVAALLDGVPLGQHDLIKDYILLDDPDNFSSTYAYNQNKHGTSMASLICHNDLLKQGRESISRKIYVRPIMRPNPLVSTEEIPQSEFPEDLVERAVVRMIDGEVGVDPQCPHVKIINLSIGNIEQPFIYEMSPWAKLLDWLSWKYKVLFIVSAGNYRSTDGISVPNQADRASTITDHVVSTFIQEIESQHSDRKILSPAESINSLTVGAIHHDFSSRNIAGLIDPYDGKHLAAEYSCNGPGFRSQIKPDILVAGGRLLYEQTKKGWIPQYNRQDVGQKVASIGKVAGDVTYMALCSGTSNAAAITTHAAAHIHEVISSLNQNNDQIPEDYYALVIKSLLVHGAQWGDIKDYGILKNKQNSRKIKRIYAKHLGYGAPDFDRVMSCTEKRVTLIGFGSLTQKDRHRFRLPLPNTFDGLHIRLIATLAWFTPINLRRYGYRQAKLFFEIPSDSVGNRQNADWQQVRNGTLQHEIFEISRFSGNHIDIEVQCGPDAAEAIEDNIPYAICFTLESAQETPIDLYSEISQLIGVRV